MSHPTTAQAAGRAGGDRWLFGPLPDLAFGCGLLYALFFGAQVVAGDQLRQVVPLAWQSLLTLVFGGAHYGATLLRVYEQRGDRRKYAFFAVHLTVFLIAIFVISLYYHPLGSLVFTVYATWSPWHYSGQNYGIALMFLRRRGVEIAPGAKRLFYLTFLLSFGLTFLSLHGALPGDRYVAATDSGTVYRFLRLGLPAGVADPAFALLAAAYGVCLAGSTALFLRAGARLRDLGPAAALVAIQALWFLLPRAARHWDLWGGVDPFSAEGAAYAFMWIAMGHFAQYLWITTYYAARSRSVPAHGRFLLKALLAGASLFVVPKLVFAPGVLGSVPWDLGLAMQVAAIVNIHHFILDGAIWKLRDGRVARVLIRRSEPDELASEAIDTRRTPAWAARAAWATGVLVLAIGLGIRLEYLAFNEAAGRGDLGRVRTSIERLRWLGKDSPRYYVVLAERSLASGLRNEAIAYLKQSIELYPTADAWVRLAQVLEASGAFRGALQAYDAALALDPGNPQALFGSGLRLLEAGEVAEAQRRLRMARRSAPDEPALQRHLEEASRRLREAQ